MNVKSAITAAIVLTAALALSACAGQSSTSAPTTAPARPTAAPAAKAVATTATSQQAPTQPAVTAGDLTRTNEGGAVTFAVKPLNLGGGTSTLDFDVAMNTHSVELSAFDLKQLAVLKTDAGVEIAPSAYQGGGGHHVDAKLSFPADKIAGAKTLTLILKNVAGVAERTFTWNLQ